MRTRGFICAISCLLLTVTLGCSERPEPAPVVSPPLVTTTVGTNVIIRIHEVAAGEDLYSLALMWDVSVADLKNVNDLESTTLRPGQKLKIPIRE